MQIDISNRLTLSNVKATRLPEVLKAKLTLPNPLWQEAKRMNRWTGNIDKELHFYQDTPEGLAVPRGLFRSLKLICTDIKEPIQIIDNRRTLPEIDFSFTGELRDYQEEAVAAVTGQDEGVLCAPTGSGKTIIALAIIAARRQPTLIIVHNKELMNQWIERIETFLDIPRADIGQIGAGKKVIGEKITIGIVNSIYPVAQDIQQYFCHVIADECHRAPARMFTEALAAFDAKFILGLSATPFRRDGLSSVIYWHCGPLAHKIQQADLELTGDIVPADVILRYTHFQPLADPGFEYGRALAELTEDYSRNSIIAADVAAESTNGAGICLVLTDRKKHAETLKDLIALHNVTADILTGELSTSKRAEIVGRLNTGDVKILIATGALLGEGFDCRGLSTLFMATPISYQGRVIQYLGRVLRPAPGKSKALIFDYIDRPGVWINSAQKRQSIYRKNQWRYIL